MNNKLEIIKNDCVIEIENKKYYIYESYILNGTGYTFRIYADLEHNKERHNCFWDISSGKIVIIDKKYNYLLNRKGKELDYEIIKYDKNILKLEITEIKGYKYYSIHLNDFILFNYGENKNIKNIWNNEINNRYKIMIKQKITTLNNA